MVSVKQYKQHLWGTDNTQTDTILQTLISINIVLERSS